MSLPGNVRKSSGNKEGNPVNKKSYLYFWIGAVSLLLIDVLSAMPADAHDFSCRASALRVELSGVVVFEPSVANPPEVPCKSGRSSVGTAGFRGISANVLNATTVDEGIHDADKVTADATVASVTILPVLPVLLGGITAKVVFAHADNTATSGGTCKLSSNSGLTNVFIAGVAHPEIGTAPVTINLPGVGILRFNATITEAAYLGLEVTQRAIWLTITNLTLASSLGVTDVIVGEATADFERGNPCLLTN